MDLKINLNSRATFLGTTVFNLASLKSKSCYIVSKKYTPLAIVIFFSSFSGFAFSSETTSVLPVSTSQTLTAAVLNTTTTTLKTEKPKEKSFSLSTSIEYSQKVEVPINAERDRGTDLSLAASYKINNLYSASAKTALTQDLTGPKNSAFSDISLGFSVKGIEINKKTLTTHSVSALVPISTNSLERDRLRTSIGLSNGISYTGDRLISKYKLSLSKNFHEFSQNADGLFLTEYRITNSVELAVPVTEKFSISATGLYRASFTYDKDAKYGFGIDADLNYDFTEKLSVNLGASNEGNALKSNGTDSNINIYNEASSVFRAGITYVY